MLQKLIAGLHAFQASIVPQDKAFYANLAAGQSVDVLFITCSDSRIAPNLITQTKPGELFIIRNAGNLVPPYGHNPTGEAATIEYAVEALGVTDIIVCGHSGCGAMRAIVEPEGLDDLPAMSAWLIHAEATRRIVKAGYAHLSGADLVTATVQENVLVQVDHLRTHPTVAAALAGAKVRLHAWTYEIETGVVHAYDPSQGQYAPIDENVVPVIAATRGSQRPWS